MSFLRPLTALVLSLGLSTSLATAGESPSSDGLEAGLGRVQMVLPQPSCEGWMNAELLDDKGQARYLISAQMTRFVVAVQEGYEVTSVGGGIYGQIREAIPAGVHMIAAPQPFAYVEGTWNLDQDQSGAFQLTVYERDAKGAMVKAGAISGRMHAHELSISQEGESSAVIQAERAPLASAMPGQPYGPIASSAAQAQDAGGFQLAAGQVVGLQDGSSRVAAAPTPAVFSLEEGEGEAGCTGLTVARGKLGYALNR